MARARDSADKAPPPRRMRGFEAASALLGRQMQAAAERRGFAVARLLTHWADIAGAELAAMTRPVRISHGKGGFGATLTLICNGAVAPLVEMRLPQLRERVNACYGYNAVQRILLTQTAAQGFAEAQAAFAPAPAAAATPDPQAEAAAQAVAARFDDPTLAAAMARLALHHATRHRSKRKDLSPC